MSNILSPILAVAIADFRERSRRYSFWVFLVMIIYATYLFLPGNDAPYVTVRLGDYRGIYNSAWVSSQVTMMTVTLLTLVGFYFAKGSLNRELRLKTHELIASSPIRDFSYVAGKALSNGFVLFSMIAVLAVTSALLQIARAEDRALNLILLVTPYLLVSLPLMIAISAVAVLFDSIKLLRGGIGNVVFMILWSAAFAASTAHAHGTEPWLDLFGADYLWNEMVKACASAVSDYVPWQGPHSVGFSFSRDGIVPQLKTFVYAGPNWSAAFMLGRLLLLMGTGAALLLATLTFRRFREERAVIGKPSANKVAADTPLLAPEMNIAPLPSAASMISLTHISDRSHRLRLFSLLVAELRVALNQISLWWYFVAAGIFVAGMLAPYDISHKFLLAAAWFWPLLIWSKLGCRDQLFDTHQMVQSTAGGAWRQLSMQWLAGFVIAAALGSFFAIRAIIAGDIPSLTHWLTGAMFISSLAITCGIVTGGRKLFEVLYTILFYAGPLNKTPYCDFTGSVLFGSAQSSLLLWGSITIALLPVAALFRKWQLIRS